MKYKVIPVPKFKKEAKRLIKKFPSLKSELFNLNELLQKEPKSGTSLGFDTYKVRVAIKSKGKGKSGGARVITYFISEDQSIYLLTIYDKSELDAIDERVLRKIIEGIKNT